MRDLHTLKKAIFILPLALLTVSALANIIVGASVSDVGARIHEYETKTAVLENHSDELMTQLAEKQSLAQLKVWAVSAGFVPRTSVVTVTPQSPKLAAVPGI